MKKTSLIFVLVVVFAFILRVYGLNDSPPGLYSDEAAYGYNAYSLLKTGHDEYGKSWPLALKSFGDFKPPMTAWLTMPSVVLFGLNEFAIRFPSALAGTISVIGIYYLCKEMLYGSKKLTIFDNKYSAYIPIGAALLLAISPWHLLFSRSSMLVGIEVMFITWGLLFFLKALKKQVYLPLSSIFFAGAIYSYYGSRITVPLLVTGLFLIFRDELWKIKKTLLLSTLIGLLLITPLFVAIAKEPEILTGRAKTVSVFYDTGIAGKLWEAHALDGQNFPVLISRFFHNKPYFYFKDILRRYSQHFSIDFLFVTGDTHPPFDIPGMGIIYLIDVPFILMGLFLIIKYKSKKNLALLVLLFSAPVAASLTFVTPSANRSFLMIVGFIILSALGIFYLVKIIAQRFNISRLHLTLTIFLLYTISFTYFIYNYLIQIPGKNPQEWHYGRKELVQKVSLIENNYKEIMVSDKGGPSYIWFLFYKKYDPEKYWQSAKIDFKPDQYGFIHVKSFDKYTFSKDIGWGNIEKRTDMLYIGFQDEIPDHWEGIERDIPLRMVVDQKVYYPNDNVAFKIVHLEPI